MIDPTDSAAVARACGAEFGSVPSDVPELAGGGFEAYNWFVSFDEPLHGHRDVVVRIYPALGRQAAAERTAGVLALATAQGAHAPTPLASGDSSSAFGLPYVLMSRAHGVPLGSLMNRPWRLPVLINTMAAAVAHVHRLPTDGWAGLRPVDVPQVDAGAFAAHPELADARERITRMAATITTSTSPAVVHGDLSPANVLVDAKRRFTIIDWGWATLGDRHADLGYFTALLAAGRHLRPGPTTALEDRITAWAERRFIDAYRRFLPVDDDRLRFAKALHLLKLWSFAVAATDPDLAAKVGAKPEATSMVGPKTAPALGAIFDATALR